MQIATLLRNTTLALAVVAFSGMAAQAEEKKSHDRGKWAEKKIERMDTNKDGVISLEEYLAHATKRFEAKDADNSGSLTAEEIQQYYAEKRAKYKEKKKTY